MRWGLIAAGAALLAPVEARADCAAAIAYSDAHGGAAVLVVENGRVKCRAPQGEERAYELASGTKSVVGLAAAAAVQDGLLALDEPVSDTLTEWRANPLKKDATIRQLLSMTAGLRSQVGRPPGYAEAAAMPFTAAPGERFQYGPAPMQVFGELMNRKLAAKGRDADVQAYVERRIFAPIGFRYAEWRKGPDGRALLPQGLVVAASEWAKLGGLVLDGGRVGGKPIVDPAAFAALFQGTNANPTYGLTWWLAKGPPSPDRVTRTFDVGAHAAELPSDLAAAAGAGNQRLYVIPSRHMMAVRQARIGLGALARLGPRAGGQTAAPDRWSDTAFLQALFAPAAAVKPR
jgi:CubicO group peptidase (beta-lactamase class C family)